MAPLRSPPGSPSPASPSASSPSPTRVLDDGEETVARAEGALPRGAAGVALARLSLREPSTSLAARVLDDGEETGARAEGPSRVPPPGLPSPTTPSASRTTSLADGAAPLRSLKRSVANVVRGDEMQVAPQFSAGSAGSASDRVTAAASPPWGDPIAAQLSSPVGAPLDPIGRLTAAHARGPATAHGCSGGGGRVRRWVSTAGKGGVGRSAEEEAR